jgi:hypothetical protein
MRFCSDDVMHWQQGGAGRLPVPPKMCNGVKCRWWRCATELQRSQMQVVSQGSPGGLTLEFTSRPRNSEHAAPVRAGGLRRVGWAGPGHVLPTGGLARGPFVPAVMPTHTSCLLTRGRSGHVARCCPASSSGLGWAAPPPSAPLQRHRHFAKVGRPGPPRLGCSGECLETALGVLGLRRSGLPWLLLICSLPLTLLTVTGGAGGNDHQGCVPSGHDFKI